MRIDNFDHFTCDRVSNRGLASGADFIVGIHRHIPPAHYRLSCARWRIAICEK